VCGCAGAALHPNGIPSGAMTNRDDLDFVAWD
jgi:hypothetical protein